MAVDLKKLEVTKQYLEKYPYSDVAMYVRYKESRSQDPAHKAFIRWFEGGKKPLGKPNFKKVAALLHDMRSHGLTKHEFKYAIPGASETSMEKLYYCYTDSSDKTCARLYPQIKKFYDKWMKENCTEK